MAVFFWLLLGLTWIGGVISMLTENLSRDGSVPNPLQNMSFSKFNTFKRISDKLYGGKNKNNEIPEQTLAVSTENVPNNQRTSFLGRENQFSLI
jgi:hypothetical protein